MDRAHENLIEQLCQDVTPVKPLWSPSRRALLWLLFCFALSIAFVLVTGEMRHGFQHQLLDSPRFLIETGLGFISGIVAAFFAFEMVVPGTVWTPRLKFLSIAPFVLFILLSAYSIFDPAVSANWNGWRFGCERDIMMYGALPMLVFFLLAKRAAPVESAWTGMLMGIAAMAPSAAMMQLACMYSPWHTFGFHIAPILLIALVGVYLGKRVLKL